MIQLKMEEFALAHNVNFILLKYFSETHSVQQTQCSSDTNFSTAPFYRSPSLPFLSIHLS